MLRRTKSIAILRLTRSPECPRRCENRQSVETGFGHSCYGSAIRVRLLCFAWHVFERLVDQQLKCRRLARLLDRAVMVN